MTRQQLARKVGIHLTTISRIEAGKQAFPATLEKLAAYFKVAASDLPREALPVAASRTEAAA
jgi:transcriptional regulator with XRE-family HTH domain